MYGETFYGRHTAQHQLQWSPDKSILLFFIDKDIFIDK